MKLSKYILTLGVLFMLPLMVNAQNSNCVTITTEVTNVLYAGIDNPISINVPGVPSNNITVYATNAKLTETAQGYTLKPLAAGQDCEIIVVVKDANGNSSAETKTFRVRALPEPTAHISFQKDGYEQTYKGLGKPISKANLVSASGIRAEVADFDLDIRYRVIGFDLITYDSMGNSLIHSSNSATFTEEQKVVIYKLSKGKKFFIARIKAIGPDGIERVLPAIDGTIN